jgi:hypothetical protein
MALERWQQEYDQAVERREALLQGAAVLSGKEREKRVTQIWALTTLIKLFEGDPNPYYLAILSGGVPMEIFIISQLWEEDAPSVQVVTELMLKINEDLPSQPLQSTLPDENSRKNPKGWLN